MSSGEVSAVTAMIGTPAFGPSPARMRRVVSRPSSSGIRTSMKIRSKAVFSQIFSAAMPSAAVAMSQPSGCRISWMARRLMSWSSTTSTRIGRSSPSSLSSTTGSGCAWVVTAASTGTATAPRIRAAMASADMSSEAGASGSGGATGAATTGRDVGFSDCAAGAGVEELVMRPDRARATASRLS